MRRSQAIRQQAAEQERQDSARHLEHRPDVEGLQAEVGLCRRASGAGIRAARALGSPILRVVLGTFEDRLTDGGIARHIEQVVKVCQSQKSRAVDAGVKIAVENHAGDMHSTELAQLVEAAGKDFVGVNLDSGNALWTLEDPIDSLRTLAPYVLTTSLRDSAMWETPKGAAVAWTAMGEGQIDLKAYFADFRQLCPGVPVHIETISGFNREFPYLTPEFWKRVAVDAGRPLRPFPRARQTGHTAPDLPGARRRGPQDGGAGISEGRDRAEPEVLQGRAGLGARSVD